MANGRNKLRKGDAGRDAGGFVALPWSVMDCPAYAALSHPARGLLMEVARQFVRDNNGRLLASGAYLAARGWKSADVITRAKRELLEAGFIHETVKGHRPNRASWYAVTWHALDRLAGYDVEAAESFRRGAYRLNDHGKIALPTPSHGVEKNAPLTPSHGVVSPPIAPPHGVETGPPTPSHGAIRGGFGALSTPSHGNHLENHLQQSEATEPEVVDAVKRSARSGGPASEQDGPTTRRRPRQRQEAGHMPKGGRPQFEGGARPVPQPPGPTAQLELLMPT